MSEEPNPEGAEALAGHLRALALQYKVLRATDAERPDLWKPYPSTPAEAPMKTGNTAYRSAVGVALAAAFILVWLSLGVGVIGADGDRANLMYVGVLAVGIVGAIIARFRPQGMARALVATAIAQALVAVIALILGLGAPWSPPGEIVALNGFFVALFAGSAWLFRHAARAHPRAGAGPQG